MKMGLVGVGRRAEERGIFVGGAVEEAVRCWGQEAYSRVGGKEEEHPGRRSMSGEEKEEKRTSGQIDR